MHSFLLALILLAASTTAFAQKWICTKQTGADLLQGTGPIQVERTKSLISVKKMGWGQVLLDDEWTYFVTVDAGTQGFRAMRANSKYPKIDSLDALLGGELFLVKETSSLQLFVVGSNASAKSSESATYACVTA